MTTASRNLLRIAKRIILLSRNLFNLAYESSEGDSFLISEIWLFISISAFSTSIFTIDYTSIFFMKIAKSLNRLT